MKTTGIVLSAGRGKRMQADVSKQYMLLEGKPIIYYSLKAFEDSFVDEIILVVGENDLEYVQKEILDVYQFQKVKQVVVGGKERYHSVYQGIMAAGETDYIFIHDGARPFLTQDILVRAFEYVKTEQACVVGMPVKDTIKIADEEGYAAHTPKRDLVWMVQTPQVFSYKLVKNAYCSLIAEEENLLADGIKITDDAMVVEHFTNYKVKLVEGSYENIKITTPEDLEVAKSFLKKL